MKCPFCKTENPSNNLVCISCGRKIKINSSSSVNDGKNFRKKGTKGQDKSWDSYKRTGNYFVLDVANSLESGDKEEIDSVDSADLLTGRYKIIRKLGSGGMSVVFLARDKKMEADVVIKEMAASSNMKDNVDYLNKRFEEEAKLLYRLHWSGIPKVTDFFADSDSNYLVMEYVRGKDLQKVVSQREVPVITLYEFVDWMGQLLETLCYLHQQDPPIIHRDIKPANIMLTDDGDIVLVDFGLAKSMSYFTSTQTMVGTRGYASPEHYLGKPTAASDIYSLAASFHFLLTAEKPGTRLPFEFPPLTDFREDLNEEVDYIFSKMLAKDVKERYQTAFEVLEDLNILADHITESFDSTEFESAEIEQSVSSIQQKEEEIEEIKEPEKVIPPPEPVVESKPVAESKPVVKKVRKKKKKVSKNCEKAKKIKSENQPAVKNNTVKPEPVIESSIKESINSKEEKLSNNQNGKHDPPLKIERPSKPPISKYAKAPDYSRRHSVKSPEPPLESPFIKPPPGSSVYDEFREETFLEKAAGSMKFIVLFLIIAAISVIAYLYVPGIIEKYKSGTAGSPVTPLPSPGVSLVPSPKITISPIITPSGIVPSPEPEKSETPKNITSSADLEKAKEYLKTGKNDKAILLFDSILKKNPDDVEALLGRGSAYLAVKDLSGAFNDFSRVIDIDPKNSEAYLKRSLIHKSRKAYDEAEKDLLKLLALNPGSSEIKDELGSLYYSIGDLHQQAGNNLRAINAYIKSLKYKPLDAQTKKELAKVYGRIAYKANQNKKYRKAVKYYNQTIDLVPDEPVPYFLRGYTYYNLGNKPLARKDFDRYIQMSPNSKYISKIPRDMRKNEKDKNNIAEKKNSNKQQQIKNYLRNADLQLKERNFKEADRYAEQALHIDNKNIEANFYKGIANVELGRMAEAEKFLNYVIENTSGNSKMNQVASSTLVNKYITFAMKADREKNQKASEDLGNKILKIAKDHPAGYIAKGVSAALQGNKKEALAFLKKAQKYSVDPKNPFYQRATELIEILERN